MNKVNARYQHSRNSDGRSVYFYYSEQGYWVLDSREPGGKPSRAAILVFPADLPRLAEAVARFRATGENQNFNRNFGEFDQRLTVITAEKILNKNGFGIALDDDDRRWLVDVIHQILDNAGTA